MSRLKAAKILVIILVIFSPFISSHLKAQTVAWAKTGISPGFENGNAIVTDDSGNVYVTGQFEFSTYFGTTMLYADGSHDIFVAKYDTYGALLWVRKAGGISGDIGLGIGIDAMHNVYITGEVEDTVKFSQSISVISQGSNDIFLAKYDRNGNVIWANGYGSVLGSDKGRALAVSPTGNCYVTGNFTYTTAFGNVSLSTNGGNDIFVTKINTNGTVMWAKKAGGSNQDRGYGIAIDENENVFVTGIFALSATFKNTTITNAGQSSAFIAKYDSSGQFQWVKAAGACCDTTKANSIVLDAAGNIYIAGSFNVASSFDNYNLTSAGMGDIFIAKYNSVGDVLWAKRAGGTDDDGAYGVAVDNLNQTVYLTGMISGTSQFDNQTIPIAGYRDIFVAAYESGGNLRWVKTNGGFLRDIGSAITVDKSGFIYSTGLYNGVAEFDTIVLNGYPNEPWADLYVDKISPAIATMPSNIVAALNITPANCYDLAINFTPGNGSGRLIIARQSGQVNSMPVNGTSYSGDSIFGNGSMIGNGNFVVYDGPGNQVTVSGLTSGTQYYFTAIEYNGYGASRVYNTTSAPVMSAQSSTYSINISGLQNTICAGAGMTLIAGGASSYDWSPAAGLSSTTSAMVQANPAVSTSYTITGTTANGCHAETNFSITVNPLPVITITQLNAVCENSLPISLNIASPQGGTYSGAGVNGGRFYPSISGAGIADIQYEYTSTNGCTSFANTTINVMAAPAVSLNALSPVCANSSAIILNNGNPSGGTYSGNGVNAGVFNPSAGPGNYSISYSYTDNNGCSSSANITAIVNALPSVNIGNDTVLCANDIIFLNAGTGFNSYAWSNGSTTNSIIADSSGTGLGNKSVFVTVTNASGCSNSDTVNVVFDICAGIAAESQVSIADIYPNPFQKTATISSKEKVSVTIYDVNGRVVAHDKINGEFSFGEKLAAGTYYIQVIGEKNRKVYRVMKSN